MGKGQREGSPMGGAAWGQSRLGQSPDPKFILDPNLISGPGHCNLLGFAPAK